MDIVIEGDIDGAFNNLDHDKLIKILSRRIHDEKFLTLIYGMCRAGIFDQMKNVRTDSLLGVPQGGITSPTLWNIYMHELDKYIQTDITNLINTINTKQERSGQLGYRPYKLCMYHMNKNLTIYYNLTKHRNLRLHQLTPAEKSKAISAINEYEKYKKLSLTMPSKRQNKATLRILYLRYADDWILITNGKPVLAQYIKNKIASFLKYQLGLTLSSEKTKITDLRKDEVYFLGYSIKKQKQKLSYTTSGALKRVTGQRITIVIDRKRLLARVEWRGYNKKGKPREQPAWSTQTDFEIIGKYNSVIRGLVNYYAPVINYRSSLNYYVYILEYSCYKTLYQKYKTSIRKLLRKHGQTPKSLFLNNDEKERQITLLTCKTYWSILKPSVMKIKETLANKVNDPGGLATSDFLNNAKTYLRTSFKMYGRCVICGCKEHIQMHHIKSIQGYGKKAESFVKIMALLNRKQIPVCKHHHDAIHDGKYDDISLSDLYDTRIAQVENYLKLI